MQIKINGNIFEHGDEVTVITDYNNEILHGKISIKNQNQVYICHNNHDFHSERAPEMIGFSYALKTSVYEEDSYDSHIFLHKVPLERLFKNDNFLKKGISNFLYSQGRKLTFMFNLKLGVLDKYDSVKQSEQQGYVDLHSSERNKKLSIKIGRLIRKINTAYNEVITQNPKNNPLIFKDEEIEKIHNLWMCSHESSIKYELLKGNDILKGYNLDNYSQKDGVRHGTLGQSCMIGKYDFLKLYIENPEKISLMVFYDEGKICGRCLIWNCDDGKTYYDRIYYTYDWYEYAMDSICKKQGYEKIYCSSIEASVKLNRLDFMNYPYVDTFFGISFKDKTLHYSPSGDKKFRYEMRTTTGQINENHRVSESESI